MGERALTVNYAKQRHTPDRVTGPCRHPDCERAAVSRSGLCKRHDNQERYRAQKAAGTPVTIVPSTRPTVDPSATVCRRCQSPLYRNTDGDRECLMCGAVVYAVAPLAFVRWTGQKEGES